MADADPWLTYTCTAPLPPFDRVANPPVAEMLYTSPACITFSRAEEAQKFKCRIVFKGTPKGDPRDNDFAEYQEAAKKEFAMLKKSGVFNNLELTDSRDQEATPDVGEESITLRYCGIDSSDLLEKQIDNRKGKKKVHTWPGCCKVAKVQNAPLLEVRRFNTSGEDRCKIINDLGLWCRECNPDQFIVPLNLRHVDWL